MRAQLHSLGRNVLSGLRLALFLPVSRADFRIGVVEYAVLAVFNLLVWLVGSYARSGEGAQFLASAVPALLAYIPIGLLFCLLAAKLLRDEALFAAFAVVLASTDLLFEIAGSLIYLCLDRQWLALPPQASLALYTIYVGWAIACVLRALHVLAGWRVPGARLAALTLTAMVLIMVYIPRDEPWVVPPPVEDAVEVSLFQEELFHAQEGLLDRELDRLSPQRPGEPDLYFLGAAPYARQQTFVLELAAVRKLLEESFDTAGRSVSLMNHASALGAAPLATATNLRLALMDLGDTMNVEEDVLMLFLTSHGSAGHELAFDFPPLQLRQVNPTALSRMLADSGIKWKIIVISACYSGGFIEALKDDNTLVITAADATHTSFGCEAASDYTWFSRAFFDQALREEAGKGSYSFTAAFERAKTLVAEREKEAGYEASNPQMFVGASMKGKLKTLEARLAARAAAGGSAAPSASAP